MHEYADRENPMKAVIYGETADTFTVGGYGVVFGGEDLEGETFTKDTDFWLDRMSRDVPVLYQHGQDKRVGLQVIGKGHISDPDDFGLWVETQMNIADEYAEFVRKMAAAKKLGYSSGTAKHLARWDGSKIKSWPIVEMTLTPTPAEPRTLGVSEIRSLTEWAGTLSALLPEDAGDASAEAKQAPEPAETITEPTIIAQIEIKETEMAEEIKATETAPVMDADAMADAVFTKLTERLNALPGMDKALNLLPEGKDRPEEKSFADWLVAVGRGDAKRLEGVYKTALSEESGEVGGYLVPVEYSNDILRIAAERSVVRANGPTVINMTTREWNVPALSYLGSTAGRAPQLGGVYASWTAEAAEKTETEPTFENVKLVYHELSGYTLASAHVMMDAGPTLESMLRELFADAVAFHEDWAFIQGDGVGKPLGVLKSDCLLTEVAASSTFVLDDIASMLEKFHSRRPNGGVWFMHPKVLSKLIPLADGSGATNNVIWIPSARDNAPATLFGRPIVFTDRMPILPAGTGATQIGGVLLADWSYYLIGDRAGLSIDYSSHYKFINNQGTWRFSKYLDGQPWMSDAMYLADGSNQVSPFVSLSGS